MLSNNSDDVGKGASEFLSVSEVDALVGCMGVSLGSNKTERDNLSLGVHLLELSQERDGASHTVRSGFLAIPEFSSRLLNSFHEPGAEFSHAPALSLTLVSKSDLSVVRDILSQEVSDGLVSIIRADLRRESNRQTDTGGGSNHISSNLNVGETGSSSDGHVSSPGVVEVHLGETILITGTDTFVDVVFLPHRISTQLSHEFSFFLESFRDLALELFDAHAILGVIDAIKESTHDTEGLGDDSTNFSRVVATLSSFDSHIYDSDTTERRGHPELVPVESTRVHAEHEIGLTNSFLGDIE